MPDVNLQLVPEYYHRYINQVPQNELAEALSANEQTLLQLLKTIAPERWEYKYAEGKWTIKEVVQHIIDAERIFCYRALCFARKDETSLPGFDENSYADHSHANRRSPKDLLNELEVVQAGTSMLFNSFDEEQLQTSGIANGKSVLVKGIGFIICGHALHHMKILQERYLAS